MRSRTGRRAGTAIASSGQAVPVVLRDTQPVERQAIALPSRSAATVPVAPPAPVALASAPEVRENPTVAIASVIASYARALESRDITELRRVYPSMTAAQRRAFEDFFRSTRSLQANLSMSDLQVDGATAEARVSGTYVFVTSAGASERQTVNFRAGLRRDGSTWTLTAVR